jgi:hypothetical protein
VALAQVEDLEMLGVSGRGASPDLTAPASGTLWLVVRGGLRVEAGTGDVALLSDGDLTLIPGETPYRLVCDEPSLLVTLAKV